MNPHNDNQDIKECAVVRNELGHNKTLKLTRGGNMLPSLRLSIDRCLGRTDCAQLNSVLGGLLFSISA
jgi:hypothetical protein